MVFKIDLDITLQNNTQTYLNQTIVFLNNSLKTKTITKFAYNFITIKLETPFMLNDEDLCLICKFIKQNEQPKKKIFFLSLNNLYFNNKNKTYYRNFNILLDKTYDEIEFYSGDINGYIYDDKEPFFDRNNQIIPIYRLCEINKTPHCCCKVNLDNSLLNE